MRQQPKQKTVTADNLDAKLAEVDRQHADAIAAARSALDSAAAVLDKRRSQLADTEAAAHRAEEESNAADTGRAAELVPARIDGDASAKERLAKLHEQAWRADRERRDALATATDTAPPQRERRNADEQRRGYRQCAQRECWCRCKLKAKRNKWARNWLHS
jgi:hypothetical protein